jgi:hypothetical protein
MKNAFAAAIIPMRVVGLRLYERVSGTVERRLSGSSSGSGQSANGSSGSGSSSGPLEFFMRRNSVYALTATLRRRVPMLMATSVGMLTAAQAWAASLSGPITGWASGVPGYISMYEYVPAKLAANPSILVVSHYCGGNAAGVFGEAQGGGLVSAADQYGFVMIFPQTSNNCWDVGSTASLTHNLTTGSIVLCGIDRTVCDEFPVARRVWRG